MTSPDSIALPDLATAVDQWLELFETSGITAVLSLQELDGTAAVVIRPPRVAPQFGANVAELTWQFLLVAGDTDTGSALTALGELLSKFYALTPGSWTVAEPTTVTAGADLGSLPGYLITISQTLKG